MLTQFWVYVLVLITLFSGQSYCPSLSVLESSITSRGPGQQLPQRAAQALTEQDFLTENGTTFLVPNRLCTEEACLATACVVAVKKVRGLMAEHQASAIITLHIF